MKKLKSIWLRIKHLLIPKVKVELRNYSTDFQCWQIYVNGCFKGFACTPDTRFIKLIPHERRLGGKTGYIYWSMNKFKERGYKISY